VWTWARLERPLRLSEARPVDGALDAGKDVPDLVAAQDHGELLLLLGPGDIQDPPLPSQGPLVEELDAAQRDGVGAAGHLLDGGQVDQVMADLLLGELVRGAAIGAGQVEDGLGLGLHGPVGVALELEVLDHALAQGCHDLLLVGWVDGSRRESDTVGGLFNQRRSREGGRTYPPQAD
jgi:hypothetical protein